MATPERQILAYQRASADVRRRLETFAAAYWTAMPSHRDRDVERFISALTPRVAAGQLRIARLTDAYLAALLGVAPAAVEAATGRQGTPPQDVYRRPAATVYATLAAGDSYPDATQAGLRRLLSLIATDLELAQRAQEQVTLARGSARYYRRVLTGAENCTMCAIASTQRYHVGTLKPIHPGCDCDVAPIEGSSDPGQVINAPLLAQIHESTVAKLGGTDLGARDIGLGKVDATGASLSDFTDLILVREHGELGPVLTWRKHAFTSKDDL